MRRKLFVCAAALIVGRSVPVATAWRRAVIARLILPTTAAVCVNGVDAGPCVHLVGMDGHLIAQKRHGVIAGVFHGHGKEGDADLLAGGDQHIQFPGVGDVLHLPGQPDKPVRFAGHGGKHHDHAVARLPLFEHTLCNRPDLFDGAYRRAAEFLYNEGHSMFLIPVTAMPFAA